MKIILFVLALASTALAADRNEASYTAEFCKHVHGKTEVRYYYSTETGQRYVSVDCETKNMVIEAGLDKRSSLDSVHQALFYAHLSGKQAGVVIYDTDGEEGAIEYQIRTVCKMTGVFFLRIQG